jgi:hypothetical protein
MKIPAKVMPKFAGLKERISGDADNKDLREAILAAVPEAVKQTKDLSNYFRSTNERETCKRIFDFLKTRVKYQADDYRQVIQLPSAILRPGAIADCKSLSLFTAAILQNLGIPWHFVLTSYNDSPIPGHIYVETDSGCIIDVVWGKFDSEKKPKYKYKMKLTDNMPNLKESSAGLGATESGAEWAIRNGIWYSFNPGERLAINAKKISPIHVIARNVILTAISGNAGGLASMLKQLDIESNGVDKTKFKQSSFDKKRDIEIKWLQQGGNPNELYDSFNKGYVKPAKGKKFAELIEKSSRGEKIGPGKWLLGIFSALFGKKYTPQGMTGTGIEEGGILSSQAIWMKVLETMAATIGAGIVTAIASKVAPAPNEPTEQELQNIPNPTIPGAQASGSKTLLIVGGLAAAGALIYFLTKKKK